MLWTGSEKGCPKPQETSAPQGKGKSQDQSGRCVPELRATWFLALPGSLAVLAVQHYGDRPIVG